MTLLLECRHEILDGDRAMFRDEALYLMPVRVGVEVITVKDLTTGQVECERCGGWKSVVGVR